MGKSACPFAVGDIVVFTNRSNKAGLPGRFGLPNIGEAVRVTGILKGEFLQWEGMGDYPGGALHWSEFERQPREDQIR
jgi:hypothetical protein